MPKQWKIYRDFSGGANLSRDSRKIGSNELAKCEALIVDDPRGELRTIGKFDTHDDIEAHAASNDGGSGLFFFSSDHDKTTNDDGEDWIAISDSTNGQIESFGVATEYPENIYISLFNYDYTRLDDTLFSLYINGSRKDFGFFHIDEISYNITVYDFLNVSVFNQIVVLRGLYEYNIIITVFELQIRHLGVLNSNISIRETTLGTTLTFIMSPDSIHSFNLGSSTYNISWVNGENSVNTSYLINFNSDYVLTLNTTYYDVYFSIFNFDGLGLDKDLVRFYINSERKDFGFNTLKYDTVNLKVLDYFNATLFDENIYTKAYTEYNIYVEVWNLILNNNYTHSIKIKLTRDNIADIEIEQTIPAQFGVSFRFLPNTEYTLTYYYTNGTEIDEIEFELESNNQIISFGWYSTEVPIDPTPIIADFMTLFFFVIFIFIAYVCLQVLYIRLQREHRRVPSDIRRMYKKRKKTKSYDSRLK